MDLGLSVEKIKGVGPKTAAILAKAGILTVRDLLYYLPRSYENYQTLTEISQIRPGKVVVQGKIGQINTRQARRRHLSITEAVISDTSGAIRAVWFNQAYRAKQFAADKEYIFSGEYELKNGRYQLTSPSAILAADVDPREALQPIYPQKNALKPAFFKKILAELRPAIATVKDMVPGTEFGGGTRAEALFGVHFPATPAETEEARAYLAYEEIFTLLLAAELNKQANQKLEAIPLPFDAGKTRTLVEHLPFKLTAAQRIATWDILRDLEKPLPMNRLLQGDVGSGKTVVAALAAHQAAANGHQTALLAPTAVLATQHAESLKKLLAPLGVRIALLTGATKHKAALKKQLVNGEIDLLIGTHAILTDDTVFRSLALCVIDEQHRLGVAQRQKLLAKTQKNTAQADRLKSPHLLAMTATPIPRSLQLTIFGDLDVSALDQLPAGRQPIRTKIMHELHFQEELYPEVRASLERKEQVYWICRAIEENPQTGTMSVKKQAEKLRKIFPQAKIEFLHGRMKADQKDQIMGDFASGKIDILVSTTVVEVGVNVPNATKIIIMEAEQYGLAQLHQLRGRVGRGEKPSACYLAVSGDNPPSRRLKELEKSTDGFYLSEVDLKLRGPGEIYGSLQHGALDLRIATITDTKLIAKASRAAKNFAKDPANMVKYPELAEQVRKYQQLTALN